MRPRIKHSNNKQELPRLQLGMDVEKYGGSYGGPGRIISRFPVGENEYRYIVAHKIEGGYGKLLHIYAAGQLRERITTDKVLDNAQASQLRESWDRGFKGTKNDRGSTRQAPTKALRGRNR